MALLVASSGPALSLALGPRVARSFILSGLTVEWNFLHNPNLPYLSSKTFFTWAIFWMELFNMCTREHTEYSVFMCMSLSRRLQGLRRQAGLFSLH